MAETKTFNSSWTKLLKEKLNSLARSSNPRLAVLGIGNELNGDDSAGNWVARKLNSSLKEQPNLFILDCGSIPENATGPLRSFKPGLVILVDAADLGVSEGTISWVDFGSVGGFSASSHTLPLNVLAEFMRNDFDCNVELLSIQPLSLEFGQALSKSVSQAVDQIVKEFQTVIVKK
jgi:hydrogenase 3 maturation protease